MAANFLIALILPLFLSACGSVPDASSLDIEQMIVNLAKTMPSLLAMFTAGAYVLGFTLVLKGIYKLKEYGEMRTSMSSQTNLWPPLITITVGTILIFFVSGYQIGLQTLFGYSSPLTYSSDTSSTDALVSSVVLIMQVVGVIAFIRGLLLLNSAGGHGAQPGSIGKGLTFVVGGLLAINIYGTWEVLVNTLVG
ncbi:MAG: type IV secretion protein IcmC [Gammaproteobacteria bacterium]|nr:type IV secretion protein IcmC [Gammaproteobacteria bacterium]